MIFVVGAWRSGTNWLQRMLAAHPRVAATPSETFLFSAGIRPLRERFHHGAISSTTTGSMYADRDVILDALRDLCDAVFLDILRGLKPSAEYLVERTPDHVHHLDLIGDVYPDAHVVHIIRDGRDVVRSLLSQSWGPDDARIAARDWRNAVETARASASGLSNYHEVQYERMLADLPRTASKLFSDLGLPIDDQELTAALAEAGARYNVDPAGAGVGTGKWRTALTPETLRVVQEETADLLSALGYEDGYPPPGTIPAAAKTVPELQRTLRSRIQRVRKPTPKRSLAEMQVLADRFLAAAKSDPSAAGDLLSDDSHVRIVSPNERFEGRGITARQRLVEALQSDQAIRGKQVFGYHHPSSPAFTYVGSFEVDGRQHPRVLIIDVAKARIRRVAFYSFGPETPQQS